MRVTSSWRECNAPVKDALVALCGHPMWSSDVAGVLHSAAGSRPASSALRSRVVACVLCLAVLDDKISYNLVFLDDKIFIILVMCDVKIELLGCVAVIG